MNNVSPIPSRAEPRALPVIFTISEIGRRRAKNKFADVAEVFPFSEHHKGNAYEGRDVYRYTYRNDECKWAFYCDSWVSECPAPTEEALARRLCSPEQILDRWGDLFEAPKETLKTTPTAKPQVTDDEPGEDEVVVESAEDVAIRFINKEHSIVNNRGKVRVFYDGLDARGNRTVEIMSVDDASKWLADKTVRVESKRTDRDGNKIINEVPAFQLWMKSPRRRKYSGVTFSPANKCPDTFYNLWTGFQTEPATGAQEELAQGCNLFLDHVRDNICRGNESHFRYVLAWCADMLQDPEDKKAVALILRGKKGTGKSIFFKALLDIVGRRHAMAVAQASQLTGKFNQHLADKLLVVAEESFWSGDKAADGPLKNMISESMISIEGKGENVIYVDSYVRIGMNTNDAWAVPASEDERRYAVFDVSEARMQDKSYFSALQQQLDNGGREALMGFLMGFDLSTVDLRTAPETDALKDQRALSLGPEDAFIYDCLCGGDLGDGHGWDVDEPLDGSHTREQRTVTKDAIYDGYLRHARSVGKSYLKTQQQFLRHLYDVVGGNGDKRGPKVDGTRTRVVTLPPREEAYERFVKVKKLKE